jgi:hypothetical protein
VIATRKLSVAFGTLFGNAAQLDFKLTPGDGRPNGARQNHVSAVAALLFVATMDQIGQPCYLKWNLRITPLVRSELGRLPPRLTLDFLMRSP